MKWTVIYIRKAQRDLGEIWLHAPNQQAVADAADKLDRLLATDPFNVGESRVGNLRIAIEGPLAIQFRVYEQERLVRVLAIRHYRRRGA